MSACPDTQFDGKVVSNDHQLVGLPRSKGQLGFGSLSVCIAGSTPVYTPDKSMTA